MDALSAFFYFNISFFIRMVIIFTLMMLYYNKIDKTGALWKITEWPWKFIAAIFFVADIIYNHYSTICFFDKAASWDETFTYRMKRYIKLKEPSLINKWRYYFAYAMRSILNFSDPGHI